MSTAAVGACDDATDAVGNSGRTRISSYAAIAMMVGRAHSSLADVTPDGHCFAQLPTIMAMAA